MRYLKEKTTHRIEIRKSKFIAHLFPLESQDDIGVFLTELKEEHARANHFCHASLFGRDAEQQTASDDGEPSRTAGVPILEVLKHHEVTDILCVVVRYFGGIKLGAGGLVRAYRKATAEVLEKARFYRKKRVAVYRITFPYRLIDAIDQHFVNSARITEKTFLENVTYTVVLNGMDRTPLTAIEHLLDRVEELEPRVMLEE
ncbi:MAG: YigZ family protein [Acholeplasmataceae bacterium]